MIKHFTAEEARNMANKCEVASRKTRSILRDIKRAAKRGRYSLNISYSDWDSVVVDKICENLNRLGYIALDDTWRAAIYISWEGGK